MKNRRIALLILGVYALSLIASAITVQPVEAAVAAGYSEYFIPGSIDQLFRIIQDNDNIPELGNAFGEGSCQTGTNQCNEMHNVISVSVATDNLHLYYDHWENGYTTGAAGDEMYTANAGDVLVFDSGDIRVQRNAADSCTSTDPNGNSTTKCYDGRDRVFVAGGAVSLSQVFWPEAQGLNTVYSNAWEVYPVKPYQSSYTMPIGEDLAALGYTDFTHTYLIVQATQDNTTVVIDDPDKPGLQENKTLNRGDVADFFHFNTGTTVNASAPVQVQFIVGQEWSNTLQASDTRSYTAVPNGLWSSSYFSPVPGYINSTDTDLYIYNPSAADLRINYQDRVDSGWFIIGPGETRSYQSLVGRFVPTNSGVYLAAADGTTKFWAVGSYDVESANYNYGFTLIPPEQLTEEYYISWAWGSNDLTRNGSPVFVTPVEDNTTIFVDHSPTDGVVDQQITLNRVQIAKLRDMVDRNNTGMHIWATGPIAVVWGEDDEFAEAGNPYIDAGYTILPLKQEWLESVLTMDKTANPEAVSAQVGSISEFTLTVQGYAYGLDAVWVYDDLPSGWAYVPGTTVITLPGGSTITGAAAEPSISGQTLTWDKFPTVPLDMNPGHVLSIVYQARVNTPPTSGYVINESTVTGTVGADTFTASDATTVFMVNMEAAKTSSAGGVVNPGDTITYTVTVNNTGGSTQNNLSITDPLPAGTTYVPQSTLLTYTVPSVTGTYRDEFSAAQYNNSNGTTNWSTRPWTESETAGTNPLAGAIQITTVAGNGVLRLDGSGSSNHITRSVPMAGAVSATLSFNYTRNGTLEPEDIFAVHIGDGVNFITLDRYNGTLSATGTYTRDITAYADALTHIRLVAQGFTDGSGGSAERVDIDNVQVQYTTPSPALRLDNIPGGSNPDLGSGVPATLVSAGDNIDLQAGQTLTLTYKVKVDDPAAAGITDIVNTAEVLSTELPDPLKAAVSDRLRGVHLSALKTASPSTVPETGGSVTYTYQITNHGEDPVTIATLADDRFSPLTGDADCKVGTVLAAGATCSFEATIALQAGNAGGGHVNVFTVTANDGFGNTGSATDSETVTYTNANPDISVTKSADPTAVPETGGNVTFTYTVTNNSAEAATITALSDNRFGALSGDADCQVNTVLPGKGSCAFTATFAIPAGDTHTPHTNIFTAAVRDDENNIATATDSETVYYTNVLPQLSVVKTANPNTVAETGGPVTYTFQITNTGSETVSLGVFRDDRFGDMFGELPGDADCQPGTVLVVGASCTYEATFVLPPGAPGTTHVNKFTVTAWDNDNVGPHFSDTETVTYVDVFPSIRLIKSANPLSLPETGGPVTFTFLVENTGSVDVTLTALTDDKFGNLIGQGTCSVPQPIAVGGSYSCTVTKNLSSDTLTAHTNTAAATAKDDGGNAVTDDDDAEVTFVDQLPAITVEKTANPTTLPETGGNVTFTYTVTNSSDEAVEITRLIDDQFGTLDGDTGCLVGTVLAGGESCSFIEVFAVPAGAPGGTHVNTFTAIAEDNENHEASDDASATVTYTNVIPSIAVIKSVNPITLPETGGSATFTFEVQNTGLEAVTLFSLTDDVFGNLDGQGDCDVPQDIVAGGSYTCQYTTTLTGDTTAVHNNTVTASAQDDEGSPASDTDDATVNFTDAAPAITVEKTANPTTLPETGGNVTFTFTVTNSGTETVRITGLTDSVYGDLAGDTGCELDTILAGGEQCSFTEVFPVQAGDSGDEHINVFSATAVDNELNKVSDTDDAVVQYTNVAPAITLTKIADQSSLPETGGDAVFTFTVKNIGQEAVTLTSLIDDVFGNLDGQGDCTLPQPIAAGGSYSCSVTKFLSGDPLDDHTNTAAATATDDEGSIGSDDDSVTIGFDDQAPAITVEKTANPTTLPETGGNVTFTYRVTNSGQEAVEITSLADDRFPSLVGDGTCQTGTPLIPGAWCEFQATFYLDPADAGEAHINTFTATAEDNEGNEAGDDDDATVTYKDVSPSIVVDKVAGVTELPETGGGVTFTYTVTNSSDEAVTITELSDNIFGKLDGETGCEVGTVLAGGESCSFDATFTLSGGEAGDEHVNVFSATAEDDEINEAADTDDATVTYTDVLPEITLDKSASLSSLPETGGVVTFTFLVENTGQKDVTLTSLVDDVFGDLDGQGDCALPQPIAVGGSYTCTVTKFISSDNLADHVNTVTAAANDEDGSTDTASDGVTIRFTNVMPDITVEKTAGAATVAETGGSVTYTFTVTNSGAEAVTIGSLTDDKFGTLSGDADCKTGITLAGGASCDFAAPFTLPVGKAGTDHANTFIVVASDNEGNSDTASDGASVTYEDVKPAITVLKSASPNPVLETGEPVTFTFEVRNTGQVAVTLDSLIDDVFGSLDGQGDCDVPQDILAGDSYTCQYTTTLSSDLLADHTNIVTALVSDTEGNIATDDDSETVRFTDVFPAITVEKTANPTSLPETGGNVTFTYTVTNSGDEAVEITRLIDDQFGTLDGDTGCVVGTVLAGGESCSFSETFAVSAGAPGGTHVNTFTAIAEDNENHEASDDASATVTYTEVLPEITVTKSADQASLPETGGSATFTFEVQNTSTETVTLFSLTDDVFGNLDGQGDCDVPQDIVAGGSYTCQYTTTLTGDTTAAHHNTVTAAARDDEGNTGTATDSETITFSNVDPAIAITKTASTASVPETGGPVTFTFQVENTGLEAVTLNSLIDDVFGNLDGQGDCDLPQTIAVGASYICQYTTTLSGDTTASHSNTVTASYQDNDGNSDVSADSEVVSFTDVSPEITVLKTAADPEVPETGGGMTYTFTVTNTSAEPVRIDSLTDSVFGPLDGDPVDCYVGMMLAGNSSCSFDATFTLDAADRGDMHTNIFTVEASDNEGGEISAFDSETVTYTDVEPSISVLKTAAVDEIGEHGGEMTYTFTVRNLSQEPAAIFFLYDDKFEELVGDEDCNTETVLAGGASCSFQATFTLPAGAPGDTHTNVFTAGVMDDEENYAEASEDETVTYIDVEPAISVTKDAAVDTVVETGENVTFTFTVTNDSLEEVTITALVDDKFGLLPGGVGCEIGTTLAVGETCSFNAVLAVPAGTVGGTHINTFTATVKDNDGTTGSASDSETITYIETPAPAISVLKEVFADGSWWDANTAPGPQIYYGEVPQFRFTVRNIGNVTLTGISLADSVYSTATCTVPASLSPNDSVDGSGPDEFSCTITAAWALGQHTNTATASASYIAATVTATDPANYLGVNYSADLVVTKTDGETSYVPGEPLTYTITVINNGPDAVVGATFSDAIPAQIARWTWTCEHADGASGCSEAANSTGNFTDTIDLPVGGSVTYTVVAETRASATADLINTASVATPTGTDDPNPANNSATDTDTAAPRVNLALVKVADAQFRPGENLSYTLTVTNNGPSDAANVVISDTLPNEVTFVSANPAIGTGPNPVTWNLGTLAAGSSRSIRLVVRVKDWVTEAFTNTASVTSTTAETSVIDNSGSATAEPEDPTPVTLGYFRAKPAKGLTVEVEWKAVTEVDHFGYKLYRTTGPVFEDALLLESFLPNAEMLYTYTDTVPSAGVYYYWLVDVSTVGAAETLHGPAVVIFNATPVFLPLMMGQ